MLEALNFHLIPVVIQGLENHSQQFQVVVPSMIVQIHFSNILCSSIINFHLEAHRLQIEYQIPIIQWKQLAQWYDMRLSLVQTRLKTDF